MSIMVEKLAEEPPLTPAATLAAKVSRFLLIAICAGPIAVFPIGLAYKSYIHFFGAEAPAVARILATPEPLPH